MEKYEAAATTTTRSTRRRWLSTSTRSTSAASTLGPMPSERTFDDLSTQVYYTMNGDNEFFINGNIQDWDRWEELKTIAVPALIRVGEVDARPQSKSWRWRRECRGRGRSFVRAETMSMWDSEEVYHRGSSGSSKRWRQVRFDAGNKHRFVPIPRKVKYWPLPSVRPGVWIQGTEC